MSDAVREPAPDLDAVLADTGRIVAALRRAVRLALREHKWAGNPIAVWRDGRVVWLPPEKIPEDGPDCAEPVP